MIRIPCILLLLSLIFGQYALSAPASDVGNQEGGHQRNQGLESRGDYAVGQLAKHNAYRAKHGSPPMTLDNDMNKAAQEYAEKLVKIGALVHAGSNERNGNGENLWMGCIMYMGGPGGDTGSEDATKSWYDEINNYNFQTGKSNGGVIGHFTQVVWKASTKLGIGKASKTGPWTKRPGWTKKCDYVVGRYSPAGNMGGQYQANVLPLQK